ncbi:MAG TPA: hypothetical protein DCL35_08550 [Candidatus Omnitrophica bacterium]|nr:hypothetical protein [Candidatus Omnitrophota bacterium]
MAHKKDNRKVKRVPVGYDLLYKVDGQPEVHLKYGRCTSMFDLSEGGMAIYTERPLAVGTELDITFHVIFKDRQSPPMEAKGRVAYCAPLPKEKTYRLGVEFTHILPKDREEITSLVKTKPTF